MPALTSVSKDTILCQLFVPISRSTDISAHKPYETGRSTIIRVPLLDAVTHVKTPFRARGGAAHTGNGLIVLLINSMTADETG